MRQVLALAVVAILSWPGALASQSQSPADPQSQSKPPAKPQPQSESDAQSPADPQQQNPPPESPAPQSSDQTPPSVQGKSSPAGQKQQGQQPQQPRRLGTVSELVRVPVTIKNSQGQIIGDLRRDEFRIFEDGREQQLALFSTDPYPLSVVVLIDNSMTTKVRDQVQKSIESIAAGLGPQDEAALMLFDEFPEQVLDFTKNNDMVFTQLKRVRLGEKFPGDFGGPMSAPPGTNNQSQLPQVPTYGVGQEKVVKDLDDAVHAAAEMLHSRVGDRRKMIFLIADGQNSHHNKWTYAQTVRLLLTSDVTVYSITVGSALLKHEPGRMTKYPDDTGGDSFFASKGDRLERLYSATTEEARNQYLLGYVPQNSPSGEYHSIEVRVERPGLNVTARKGYYYAAPRP